MPRIDPLQLLKCLSVLLKPTGGIKSKDEVQRLASLMTKFSKKLVSKCIYVSILKATETDLLIMFMTAGGWDLIYSWLSDGVAAKNWPLVIELLELLLICPVNIERLKTNACPKLIKTLSKDITADESGRELACKLVEQWLKVVRGESDSVTGAGIVIKEEGKYDTFEENEQGVEIKQQPNSSPGEDNQNEVLSEVKEEDMKSEPVGESQLPVYKITIRDGKQVLAEVFSGDRTSVGRSSIDSGDNENDEESDEDIKPVKVSKKCYTNKAKGSSLGKKPMRLKNETISRDSVDSNSSIGSSKSPSRVKEEKKTPLKKKKSIPPVKEVKSKSKPTVNKEKQNSKEKIRDKKSGEKKDIERKDLTEKVKLNKEKTEKELQEEREFKESISKIITPSISKLGKIPKKSGNKEEDESKKESTKVLTSPDIKKSEIKKPPELKKPEKKYSMSVETKRMLNNESRPKTVKTFNSKFRSTGLEETPPPPKPLPKKNPVVIPSPTLAFSDRKPLKRLSPPPDPQPPEKKIKPESPQEEKKLDKVGGIKLIPPKPKPMFLEESDVFMNALTAANLMKEPRKRKRRGSLSKEGTSDAKKESSGNNSTPPSSPLQNDDKSPPIAKPTFKFYQETLETSTEGEEEQDKDKAEVEESLEFAPPDQLMSDLYKERSSVSPEPIKPHFKADVYDKSGSLVKGVLVHLKSRRGPKKSVCWREEKELEEIRYFEMDETERVNVTKNFLDMKQMERINERENFQMARKLAVEDIMEEKVRWKALIPCDSSGAAVIPGKNSIEKDIQYAREKTVAAAFYFNKRAIPDCPAEPDLEIHATTDPAMIPLEDVTGITDSVNDFTSTPWPEPQVQIVVPPQPEPAMPPHPIQQMPPVFAPQGPPAYIPGPFQPGPPGFMPPSQLPPGDWRTGDGKILPVPEMYPPQALLGPMGPPMMPQPLMPPHGPPEMGYPMGMPGPMDEMGHFGHPFPMGPNMGPPGMISPPYQPQGPMQGPPPPQDYPGNSNDRFRNDDHGGGGRGNWYCGNGPGPYKGNHRGNWRGGMDRRDNRDRENRDRDSNNKSWGANSRGICNMFLKRGFCKNNKCHFRHTNRN